MVRRYVGALFRLRGRSAEWRLAARVLMVAAAASAGIAAVSAVVLPVAWAIDSDWPVLWPVANAASAALFVWVSWRFIGRARAYAIDPVGGRRVVWWFAAFYLTGALWTFCAVPPYGLAVPLLYAPMFLAGLAVVLVALRLVRALSGKSGEEREGRLDRPSRSTS